MKSSNLFLLVIDGPMGSGKTTTSKLLHEKLQGTARIALGDLRLLMSGDRKDSKYNQVSQERGREIMMIMVNEYLKRGISVIVEWGTNVIVDWKMKKEHVDTFAKIAKKNNTRLFIYQLVAPKDLLISRVKERTKLILNKSKLPKRNTENVERNFENHYVFHLENKYNNSIVLNSEKLNPSQIVRKILRDIK